MSAYDDDLLDEEDEEMAAERDLASDAQWKIIQKNTFTRWANEHLKTVNKNISDLEADLADGLRLVALVEVLSGKKFKFVNRRPNFRTQKLENVTMALEFLEKDEGIRIVNIDSGDIVDSKLKLILGLIWTLILHYSISMPMWEGEEPQPQEGGPTPKQRLLNWIGAKVPDLPVKNFTTDWNDGKAIGALVDAIAPGLCPDWEDWDPKKAKKNAKEAMDAAEEWLDVPQLIKPEEMTNPKVDDLSMMTYLSQFPKAKLKPGAPLRPKQNAGKVRAYGPGIEPKGNTVGNPAKFTVETFSAGAGSLEVNVIDPKGKPVKCDSVFNNDRNKTYSCTYVPAIEGEFRVIVKFAEKEIHKSPFKVGVEAPFGDPTKVTAAGPGLEKTGVSVNKKTHFEVFTKGRPSKGGLPGKLPVAKDAGRGKVEVVITDPSGKTDTVKPTIHPINKDGVYLVEYTATIVGLHKVTITFNSVPIPHSPWEVNVSPAINPKAVYATGRGIQPRGVRIKQNAEFKVHTKDAGVAEVKVQIIGPGGVNIPCTVKPSTTEEGVYECVYVPPKVGQYVINITFGGQHITRSPFRVDVGPEKFSRIVAYGPGLESGVVNQPACFTVETNGETGALGFSIEGPSQAKIDCKDNGDGSADVTYWPTLPGEYAIHILCDDEDIPQAPYMAQIQPSTTAFDASKVIAKGPGLEPTGVLVNKVAEFTVDAKKAGKATLKITCIDENYKPVEVKVTDNKDGTYSCKYTPKSPVKHTIIITWGTIGIPKSPFRVYVSEPVNPGNVKVYGPGVEKGVKTFVLTHFTVDCKTAGPGDVAIALVDEKGKDVPVNTIDNQDGTFTVEYEPKTPGVYTISVYFAEKQIPKSPIKVKVESSIDLSKVTVKGLETPIEVDEVRPVQVNTVASGKPDAPCHMTVVNPKGQAAELPLQKTPEGYQTVFAPLEPGPHVVRVDFAGQEVPKSPFNVNVEPKVDLGAVEVLGLETPVKVGEPRPITVMTSTTGKPDAPCRVMVTKPTGQTQELPTRKIPEGYTTTLAPTEVGPHKVNVDFNGKEVPKSPFNIMAEPAIDFSKVKVSGLEEPVEVGEIRPVKVDTAECGVVDAPCQITATNPAGQVRELPLQKTPTGYQGSFAPLEEGPHQVAVKYAGKELPKSPFPVKAVPQGPPCSKVKAYGPGLETGTATKPCQFTIDTREVTQPGGLGVTVEGPAESKIECRDNQDGTCEVTYYPTVPGDYNINITYADEHIPKSPFKANVKPSGAVDVSGVKAYGPGLEPDVFLDSPTGFTVDAKSVTPTGEGKVRAIVTSPTGHKTESLVKNNKDGTYDVLYTPSEKGPNTLDITYEDHPIPQSPVKVEAAPGCDPSRVKAYGPGLESGVTDAKQVFTVDVKGAGQGGLALAIDGPAETEIKCKDNRDGTCEVEYVPIKKGDYDITVKFADQHVPGSPFHVPVKDTVNPAKVRCYGPGLDSNLVKSNAPATFTVDTTEAGEAPLEVTYTDQTGVPQQADIVPVEAGKYEAKYFPKDEGKCTVAVKYANQNVPNSPFNINVQPGVNPAKVRVTGDGVQPTVLASMPVQFVIDTREAGIAELDVVIQRPDGSFIRPTITDNGDGTFTVQYTPEDCGPYKINITFGNQPVPGCPIQTTACPTGDASKCKITDGLQQTIPVEKETVISVDASQAGTGKVTCRIRSPTGTEIDIDIVENLDGTFSILFTPAFPGDYSINIKFGGQSIPEGEYIIQAVNDAEYQDYLLKHPPVGEDLITPDTVDTTQAAKGEGLFQPQEFVIPVGPIFNFVTAYIKMPSGKKAYPKIVDNKDGTVTVRYQPQETGLHELHLCYNQQEVEGSPFQFHVDALNSGFVTAYGPGLSHGVVNVPAEFTIVTKDAGAGGLSLAIEGPSKTEIKCKDNGDGTCTVTYVPTAPGEYNITVKFADKNISGSPFVAKVTAGEPKQKAQIGRSSELSLKVTETDIANLTASIRSPSGHEEPCMLKRLPNGHLGISFTPHETGEHLVNVFRDGQHIANSPFKIVVGESELGNASKVKVYGKGLEEGMANEVNEFIVDTREAGYGGLSLSIEGPSKADIECHDNEDGTCRVTYKPTEPGTYIINIKFADEHVTSSPFKVKIGGEPSERITERIMRHREAADVTHVGSECELSLKIPGTSPFDMTASVTSPHGVTELCDVVNLDDCHYSIKFVPKEMGIHTVSVKHKDMHIPGSPFQFTVGPIAGGGAHKVHAAGLGLVRGEVEQPNEFNIYTREAGAGGLSIAVEGPSKAEVDFEDRKDGSCGVTYSVSEPGEYFVSIKFNDEHIPDSPFRVPITPSIGDARKLSVRAMQNKGLTIGKPCTFVVNFNGAAKGKLQARVVSPSGAELEALVQEIDDGEYAVRFIPRENGPHLVYVSFDGCQIPDSPFRILVGSVQADPGMVQAYGEGLKTGKTGQVSKFIVNTVNAGSGALAVTVEGPSKVKLECSEVEEGYEFTYTPTAPGDYLITIKYSGTNIAGSPYKARVEGQGKPSGYQEQSSVVVETVTKTSVMSKFASLPPFQSDASKVTCDGNGLKKGYRNKQCTFNVDTSQAGNNMLFIGMIGPKGPCEELCVKHNPGLPYKITYLVKERGDYMLAVKWGEEHIPGSPFYVRVD